MNRESLSVVVHGGAKSWTRLSDWTELKWKSLLSRDDWYIYKISYPDTMEHMTEWTNRWNSAFFSVKDRNVVFHSLKFGRTASSINGHVCSVAQLYLPLWNPMDCSLPVPLSTRFSKQEYWSRLSSPTQKSNQGDHISCVSCLGRQILYHWATWDQVYTVSPKKQTNNKTVFH